MDFKCLALRLAVALGLRRGCARLSSALGHHPGSLL